MSLALLAFVCVLIVVAIISIAALKALHDENKALEEELDRAEQNLKALRDYQNKYKDLDAKNEKVKEKLRRAQTDEEVKSVLADLVVGNNNRVSKH